MRFHLKHDIVHGGGLNLLFHHAPLIRVVEVGDSEHDGVLVVIAFGGMNFARLQHGLAHFFIYFQFPNIKMDIKLLV